MLIPTFSDESFMKQAVQGLSVIVILLSVQSLTFIQHVIPQCQPVEGLFNHFFQGFDTFRHSVIFKLFWCDNTEDNVNVFWYHTFLFSHVRGHIWGGNQRERCQAEFCRTRLAGKFVLTCDSSELQPGKACCYHSRCITWTVTLQQPHEDVKAQFQRRRKESSRWSVQQINLSFNTRALLLQLIAGFHVQNRQKGKWNRFDLCICLSQIHSCDPRELWQQKEDMMGDPQS